MSPDALQVFLLAVAFDLILGEPPSMIHPVVWIGKLISILRARARPIRAYGFVLVAAVVLTTVLAGRLLVWAAGLIPIPSIPLPSDLLPSIPILTPSSNVPLLSVLVSAYLLKSTFAVRCLLQVSADIGRLIDKDIEEAKKMLPALVGRETSGLTRSQAASAVIESLSENYVDSILSPIFYFLLFAPFGLGLEAALAFKAMSTMDSMLGYKTKGLKDLGFAAARSDDLANFIPARLSILLMALARPTRAGETLRAAFRDHSKTPSPNSGWPMAACAGALGVRLEKVGYYVLMDDGKQPETSDVPRAVGFMEIVIAITVAASLLFLLLLRL
ncbi:MAG: cobalamin biosynthesis protein [Methanosaeta sp. PtaU1.Bin060]|jgi:adenosylcobinamide-phosphate synthase|nr:MAG: cobalamin biosynthesis protein [Methanosaeta sp. PtaU1.Bin060]